MVSKAMFQSVHPVTQWFKSSMILYKYSSPLCHEPSCGSPSPGRLPESRMLLYWSALLPIEMVLSNWSSRGYAFSSKKIPKIVFRIDMPMLSKSLTCASFWVEEEFVRKLLMNSIQGICVIILSVPVPVNGNSSGVLPGLHIFEKFPDFIF